MLPLTTPAKTKFDRRYLRVTRRVPVATGLAAAFHNVAVEIPNMAAAAPNVAEGGANVAAAAPDVAALAAKEVHIGVLAMFAALMRTTELRCKKRKRKFPPPPCHAFSVACLLSILHESKQPHLMTYGSNHLL